MKAVVFDMDGVLIDSEPLHFRLELSMFEELGLKVPLKQHESFLGSSSYALFDWLKRTYHLSETVEGLVSEERRRYFEILKSDPLPIIPGIPGLLDELETAGMRMAVASSAPHEQINLVMERSGFSNRFDYRVSGDDVENSKPDPAIFLKAASGLGRRPEECWVLEDSCNGVKAGNAAGMRTIGFADPAAPVQDLSAAEYIINEMPAAAGLILHQG